MYFISSPTIRVAAYPFNKESAKAIKTIFFTIFFFVLISQFASAAALPSHSRVKRIIGGTLVQSNQYPEIALLKAKSYFSEEFKPACTATLIRSREKPPASAWLLSAAHCLKNRTRDKFFIYFKNSSELSETKFPIEQIIISPDEENGGIIRYETFKINDAALIKIKPPENIKPMGIDFHEITDADISSGKYNGAIIAGYGKDGLENTRALAELVQGPLKSQNCWNNNSVFPKLKQYLLCSSSLPDGEKGTFYGDSGGPYFITDGISRKMIGVISAGSRGLVVEKDEEGNPEKDSYNFNYYAKTSYLKDFIISRTGIDDDRLFAWGNSLLGAARVYKGTEVGMCKVTRDSQATICTLDIANKRCLCAYEYPGKYYEYFNENDFDTLLGDVNALYQWYNWSQSIPPNVIFSTLSQDEATTISKTATTPSPLATTSVHIDQSEPVVPCLVEFDDSFRLPDFKSTTNVTQAPTPAKPSGKAKKRFFIGTVDQQHQCIVVDADSHQTLAKSQYKVLVHYQYASNNAGSQTLESTRSLPLLLATFSALWFLAQ